MKPPPRTKQDYERVPAYDEWISGTIDDIEHDPEHKSKWEGQEKIKPAVRFMFKLDGCQYIHRTGWMGFSYHEKSSLYKKYLCGLVDGATPDMDFDLERLKGMPIKTMWSQNGDYDNLEMIRPAGKKLDPSKEDIPF
jgi:hypothetical protein